MIRVIDVDYISDIKLALAFNDGFEGVADLRELFSKEPFSNFADNFLCFSLSKGTLCWGDNMHINPEYLREISEYRPTDNVYIDPNNPIDVLTAAFRESLEEDNPTILQAALRGYAEKIGISNIVRDSGIRSRSSAYKSISDSGSPKWETIIKLAHSIIKLEDASHKKDAAYTPA